MAEERLIDVDKDRKYKIRINEDGEEELVIDDRVEEPEVEEQPEFDMPDFDEDDEEAAVMTPEQLAARDRAREEAEAKRLNDIAELTSRALSIMDEGRYDDAVYLLDEARSLGDDGRVCALQVVALTKNYTDFSRAEEAESAVIGVERFASEEIKSEFLPDKGELAARRATIEQEERKLSEEYSLQREERQERFLKKRKSASIFFGATVIPCLIFAVLAIFFSTIMHSQQNSTNMILFFVFLGLGVLTFIATVFAARRLWGAARLLKLNSMSSSSKLGRDYENKKAQLALVERIISVYGLTE